MWDTQSDIIDQLTNTNSEVDNSIELTMKATCRCGCGTCKPKWARFEMTEQSTSSS